MEERVKILWKLQESSLEGWDHIHAELQALGLEEWKKSWILALHVGQLELAQVARGQNEQVISKL